MKKKYNSNEVTIEATKSLIQYIQFLIQQDVKAGLLYIGQNKAFKRFGRTNVERWRKLGKIKAYYRGTKSVEYKMSELLEAASERQTIEF